MSWTTFFIIGLLTPFVTTFGYATLHEIRRHRREGPIQDWRETFEFDEDAPSYEEPEQTGPDETGTDETDQAQRAAPEPDRKDQT